MGKTLIAGFRQNNLKLDIQLNVVLKFNGYTNNSAQMKSGGEDGELYLLVI